MLAAAALAVTGALVVTSVPGAVAADQGRARAEQASTTSPRVPAKPQRVPFDMKIATFNVLGSQHTAGRGGYGPGWKRARMTAQTIASKRVHVIGLQEVQLDQLKVLQKRLPNYGIWPGTRLGNQGVRLQIAWNKGQFQLLNTGHIMTRFDRQTRPIPWVKLRDRETGRAIFMVTIHNSPLGLEAERDSATRKEIALIRRLRREHVATFVTGDMNEKEEWYCKVVGGTDLRAANGGNPNARRCQPPKRRLRIDWILGGRRVAFYDYRETRGPKVRRISDHEFISARVKVKVPR